MSERDDAIRTIRKFLTVNWSGMTDERQGAIAALDKLDVEPSDGAYPTARDTARAIGQIYQSVTIRNGKVWSPEAEAAAIITARDARVRAEYWKEILLESEKIIDQRVALFGPVETFEAANQRKDMLDGWSAWLLAKHVIDNRSAAILADKEAK